jgi:hypothetical protein
VKTNSAKFGKFKSAAKACAFLVMVFSCKIRNHDSSADTLNTANTSSTAAKGSDVKTVFWKCSGRGKMHPAGLNSQEEYCEWTRKPVPFDGSGTMVGSTQKENLKLANACVFTTSFDQTREYFLTKSTVGVAGIYKLKSHPFWGTQFNSYAYCLGGGACVGPNCVSSRASDPQICKTLNFFKKQKVPCQVDETFEVAPIVTAGAVPSGRLGDKIVKPQLALSDATTFSPPPKCYFAMDPKLSDTSKNAKGQGVDPALERTLLVCDAEVNKVTNCDDFAAEIMVEVSMKLKNPMCLASKP